MITPVLKSQFNTVAECGSPFLFSLWLVCVLLLGHVFHSPYFHPATNHVRLRRAPPSNARLSFAGCDESDSHRTALRSDARNQARLTLRPRRTAIMWQYMMRSANRERETKLTYKLMCTRKANKSGWRQWSESRCSVVCVLMSFPFDMIPMSSPMHYWLSRNTSQIIWTIIPSLPVQSC